MASGTVNLNNSSASGGYLTGKIEWTSVANTSANTSSVTVRLYVKKGHHSAELTVATTGTWSYSLTIGTTAVNGTAYASVLKEYVLLCEKTVTVSHSSDGSGSLTLVGSVTGPSGTSFAGHTTKGSGTAVLDSIPRASAVTGAANVTLGNACSVKWTPAAAAFRFKLKFSLGSWSYTTGAIHPNRTSAYTYSGYTVPLDVAKQFTAASGTMSVTLYTYSDSACSVQVGSASTAAFQVTVPDNSSTKPAVSVVLQPKESPFPGIYLQRKSKVQATISAADPYGATITGYSMTVGAKSFSGKTALSDYLTETGSVTVTAMAVNSRGHTGSAKAVITVVAYDAPKLLNTAVYRCDSAGNASDSGEYLRITATKSYSAAVFEEVQYNACALQYRYMAEGGAYSDWTPLLTDTDSVDQILDGFPKSINYTVQVRAVDTVGSIASTTVSVPSENIYMHRPAGGNGMGLGGYAGGDDLLDVYWNQRVRKDLTVDGRLSAGGQSGGVCIQTVRVWGTASFTVQTRFTAFREETSGTRQSLLLFGNDNGKLVLGVLGVNGKGGLSWSGTDNVAELTVADAETGQITVTLSSGAYDYFTLISAYEFSLV